MSDRVGRLIPRINGFTEIGIDSPDPITLDGRKSHDTDEENPPAFAWSCGAITLDDPTVS